MPDPHQDLADIVEPAPPPPPAERLNLALPLGLASLALAAAAGLAWSWRRRAHLRALNHLTVEAEAGRGEVAELAGDLADIVCLRHDLPYLQADRCPAGLQTEAAAWPAWVAELEALRFAPPERADRAELIRLCQQAEAFLQGD